MHSGPSLESSTVLWKPVTGPRHQQGSPGPQKTFACCQYCPVSGLQGALGPPQIVLVARGFCVDLGVSLKIPPINTQSRSSDPDSRSFPRGSYEAGDCAGNEDPLPSSSPTSPLAVTELLTSLSFCLSGTVLVGITGYSVLGCFPSFSPIAHTFPARNLSALP